MTKESLQFQRALFIVQTTQHKKILQMQLYNKSFIEQFQIIVIRGELSKIKDNKSTFKNTGISAQTNYQPVYQLLDGKYSLIKKISDKSKLFGYCIIAFSCEQYGQRLAKQFVSYLPGPFSFKLLRLPFNQASRAFLWNRLDSQAFNGQLADCGKLRQVVDKLVKYTVSPSLKVALGVSSISSYQILMLSLLNTSEGLAMDHIRQQLDQYHYRNLTKQLAIESLDYKYDKFFARTITGNVCLSLVGKQSLAFLVKHFPKLTQLIISGQLDKIYSNIVHGKVSYKNVIASIFQALVTQANKAQEQLNKGALASPAPCPVCGAHMIAKRTRLNKLFFGCSRYPLCRGSRSVK